MDGELEKKCDKLVPNLKCRANRRKKKKGGSSPDHRSGKKKSWPKPSRKKNQRRGGREGSLVKCGKNPS